MEYAGQIRVDNGVWLLTLTIKQITDVSLGRQNGAVSLS